MKRSDCARTGKGIVQLYLPFDRSFLEMHEWELAALPIATAIDVRACSDRHSDR
jgi:hypothetical protein